MNKDQHIIEKVFVEVNTNNLETANEIKNNISSFLNDRVFPKIERLFENLNDTEKILSFDLLQIEMDYHTKFDDQLLENELISQLSEKMGALINLPAYRQISDSAKQNFEIKPIEHRKEEVFLSFIQKGFLPWYGTEKDIQDFLKPKKWQQTVSDPTFILKLKNILKLNFNNIERLVYQLDDQSIVVLLLAIQPKLREKQSILTKHIETISSETQSQLLKVLIFILLMNESEIIFHNKVRLKEIVGKSKSETLNHLNDFIQNMELFSEKEKEFNSKILDVRERRSKEPVDKDKDKRKDKSKDKTKDKNKSKDKTEQFFDLHINEIAVQNAGLIILHPFLKPFFQNIGILDKKDNIKENMAETALHTLHYLAVGTEDFFEGNMVFEKYLCNIPLNMPVQRLSLLSKAIMDEAEDLLSEVIRYWPALKNTSPDGLRQLFIHRNGKLIQQKTNFKLIVERQAQDVLLDKLDWNIGIIKLPWKEKLLFVEW